MMAQAILTFTAAEFRGPGVHHNFDDSDSGYDVDMDQKSKGFSSNQRGRIILLGDGTEVLTDSDDTEMFDHSEEDQDLASQVSKTPVATNHEQETKGTKASTTSPDPQYKAAVDEVLPKSTQSSENKVEATSDK
jgi:protein phosphatase 2C family protein 2/3